MNVQAKPVSRPWRRFLRFSVGGMIVLVLVIGAGLGWLVRSARIQRDTVAAIERAGGWVYYAPGCTNDQMPRLQQTSPTQTPWEPNWLVNAIGVDYFAHASDAGLAATGADKDLALVGSLRTLVQVSLVESRVTDAGLVHLAA